MRVTNNLIRRIYKHRNGLIEGYAKKYKIKILVHFESYQYVDDAIQREKNLKHWKREWKIYLIEERNPYWKDLWETICQ